MAKVGAKSEPDLDMAKQVAGIVVISTILLNVVFYFLADVYYKDRAAMHGMVTAETISGTRLAFGIMTAAIAASTIATQLQPRIVSHTLAIIVGLVALVGAAAAVPMHFHVVLPVALLLLGGLILTLAYFSFKGSRPAWSFLVATLAVGALITLFGATKIRNATDVSLYYALILPGVQAVTAIMLTMLADDYAEA